MEQLFQFIRFTGIAFAVLGVLIGLGQFVVDDPEKALFLKDFGYDTTTEGAIFFLLGEFGLLKSKE